MKPSSPGPVGRPPCPLRPGDGARREDQRQRNGSTPQVLAELADLVATGAVGVPVAATYRLDRVTAAFVELKRRHTRGKIVLIP